MQEYISNIITIKFQSSEGPVIQEKLEAKFKRLDQFDIGVLEPKRLCRKNMILLGISRTIFTHSLPLVATEQCYEKLLKDIRKIIVADKTKKQN